MIIRDEQSRSAPIWLGDFTWESISAAIFDFDGTLVDTMRLHYIAYREAFAEVGLELTEAEFTAAVGGVAAETVPKLLRGRPCSLTPMELHARKKQIVNKVFARDPIRVLETAELLSLLHGSIPLALASSGSREGIQILLDRLEWNAYFQTVVTGEDSPRGKPAPDPFLLAARRLGVEPTKCIVFEDTPAGIAAASAAGMRSFDVRSRVWRSPGEALT
jgi:beta-phosphoglucomutase family hydrolase